MAKRTKVAGSQVVNDIRAGMDDAGLMKKYRLSAKGLQSLFRKLLEMGRIEPSELLQRISAGQASDWHPAGPLGRERHGIDIPAVIRDIRTGVHDFDLVEKYDLSLRGLQELFDQLLRSGLLDPTDLDRRNPNFDSTVDLTGRITRPGAAGVAEPNAPAPEQDEVIDLKWECPVCGIFQGREYAKCPECGALVALLRRNK